MVVPRGKQTSRPAAERNTYGPRDGEQVRSQPGPISGKQPYAGGRLSTFEDSTRGKEKLQPTKYQDQDVFWADGGTGRHTSHGSGSGLGLGHRHNTALLASDHHALAPALARQATVPRHSSVAAKGCSTPGRAGPPLQRALSFSTTEQAAACSPRCVPHPRHNITLYSVNTRQ